MTESVELLRVRTLVAGSWAVPAFGEGLFTDADVPVVVSGIATYDPLAWTRSNIGSSLLNARSELAIVVPQDCDLAIALRGMTTSWQVEILRATALTRDAGHIDTTTTERIAIARVANFSVSGAETQISCKSPKSMLERIGPRDRFAESCRHALYGEGCGLSAAAFADSGTVTSCVGDTIEAGLASSGAYLIGGFARVAGQTRLIIANAGDGSVQVDRPWLSPGDLVGETIVCVPGCTRQLSDCDTKFSNLENFGGVPSATNLWGPQKTWGNG